MAQPHPAAFCPPVPAAEQPSAAPCCCYPAVRPLGQPCCSSPLQHMLVSCQPPDRLLLPRQLLAHHCLLYGVQLLLCLHARPVPSLHSRGCSPGTAHTIVLLQGHVTAKGLRVLSMHGCAAWLRRQVPLQRPR